MRSLRLLPSLLLLLLAGNARAAFTTASLPAALQGGANAARLRFGYVAVPQAHGNPADTRTLQLAVAILPAISATPLPDPVFYVAGGPGEAATLLNDTFSVFTRLNQTRDIVFLDPRGAGLSTPNLYMRRGGFDIAHFIKANRAWFANRDIDVAKFNVGEIAQDYEDARLALGYGQINLFATGFGTFVAQEMLRANPLAIRAAVLASNLPATDPFLPSLLPNEKRGIDAVLADVASRAVTRRYFPHLRRRFYKLVASLTASPLELSLPDRTTGNLRPVTIDGAAFLATIREMLEQTRTIRYIPLLVQQMSRSNQASLVRRFFAPGTDASKIENPLGMYLSVIGTGFAAPGCVQATRQSILSLHNQALKNARSAEIVQLAQLVKKWGVPYRPGPTRKLPKSDVPVLLLNGLMDAQCSPDAGATIAAKLTNAANAVYPRCGRQVGLESGPAMKAAITFLGDPAQAPRFNPGRLTRAKFYVTKSATARIGLLDE